MISDKELTKLLASKKSAEKELTNEQKEQNIIEWTDFYRKNWDIFNEDYLGIKISTFQKQRINTISDNDVTTVVASRGSSKSFDVGITAYDFALLYSNCTILITSMTLSQSNNIINEKMDKIFASEGNKWSSPVLCQLRKDGWIQFKKDENTGARYVEFGNGSKVFAVNCGDSARSKRSNVVIVDEYVLVKKKDLDEIILPTLEKREFGGRPKDYPEETKQIFLSSAKSKTNWGWRQLVKTVVGHYKDKTIKYGFFTGDIFTAIANGIQTKKQYIQRKKDTDDLSFSQEYLNEWLQNNELSMFKFEDFEQNQTLKTPFYPRSVEEIIDNEPQAYKYSDDDIRYVITDIALATGNENDNTVIMCVAISKTTGIRRLEYITAVNGLNSLEQVVKFKRMFYEYKAQYFEMDSRGVGYGLFDIMTTETFDKELNTTYPAWGVCEDKQLQISSDTVVNDRISRTNANETENVIIPFVATSEINNQMHLGVRKALKDKMWEILIDDSEAKARFEESDEKWITRSAEYKSNKIMPFLQTRFMINEAISLETVFLDSGNIKLKEAKRTDVKDRYIVLAMANMLADKITNKYVLQDGEYEYDENDWSWMTSLNN